MVLSLFLTCGIDTFITGDLCPGEGSQAEQENGDKGVHLVCLGYECCLPLLCCLL